MYKFWGKVKKGKGRGKELGFPTANINLHKIIPEGVYISSTKTGDRIFNSLTFIGNAKTFNENVYQAESYLLDFSGNLYGKYISIKLIKKIRENLKFTSSKSLIRRMTIDKKMLECILLTHEYTSINFNRFGFGFTGYE